MITPLLASTNGLGDVAAIGCIALGIVIALVWPWLYQQVRRVFPKTQGLQLSEPMKAALRATGIVSAFALVSAVAIYALLKSGDDSTSLTWYQAMVAGFGWEATLEKVFLSPARVSKP